MMTRRRQAAIISDKSVNVKWGEHGPKMCDNNPDIIVLDMEEGDDIEESSMAIPNKNENVEEIMKLLLSKEVDKVVNMFRIQTQLNEAEIKSLSDELKVNQAEIDIWKNSLQSASQKNDELSKELEETAQEKHNLRTQLEDSSENFAELQKALEKALGALEKARTDVEVVKDELSFMKSESGKEKAGWEELLRTKEEMIESLASEIGRKSESLENCKEELRVVFSEKEDVVKELELSRYDQELSKEKFEEVQLKNIEAEKSMEKLTVEFDRTKKEFWEVRQVAKKRQQLLNDLENVRKEDDKRMQNIVAVVKKITDDKSRIENEHRNCEQERESFHKKLEASQSESLDPLKKELEKKCEEVKIQSKRIVDQQNKIKRFTENEEWFNLITEEQNQKSKVQIELLMNEKRKLSTKAETFEGKVASLEKKCKDNLEAVLKKEKQMEGKEAEVIELKKKVEDLKMEIELTEMNSEANDALEQKTAENSDLKLKLENLTEKVKVAEEELQNLELQSKKRIEVLQQEVKEKVENLKELSKSERGFKDELNAGAEKLLLLEAQIKDQGKDIIWYKAQAKGFNKANQDLQKKLIELEEKEENSKVESDVTTILSSFDADLVSREESDSSKPVKADSKVEDVTIIDLDMVSDEELDESVGSKPAKTKTRGRKKNRSRKRKQKETKIDYDVTIVDMDLVSDEELVIEKLEDGEVSDSSDKPSTSKQTGGHRGQIVQDLERLGKELSSSKRSRSSVESVEVGSKLRRVEPTEKMKPFFGADSHWTKNRIRTGKQTSHTSWH